MSNNELVSIVIPCYNQAVYLPEAIQSVLEQTYTNWECIIVNDGSPDNTEQVANEWMQKDSRIKYVYKPNGGLSSARNAGIEQSNGTYILPLDADDRINRQYISLALDAFTRDPQITLVYAEAELFGAMSGIWKLAAYNFKTLLLKNVIYCSAIYKKSDWQKTGPYDENLKHGFEDWDFWIRLLYGEKKVYKIPEVGFYYRQKEGSMLESLLSGTENRQWTERYLFAKHYSIYEEYYGSMIANLKLMTELQKENAFLKSSIINKLLYSTKSVLRKLV